MRPSHPPTLYRLAERALRYERIFARGERVLVAVSGGPDSMALLHVLAKLAPSWHGDIVAHGIDHGLRPQAPAELELAARLASQLGVPFATTTVDLRAGANLMARARALRHRALSEAARACNAAVIATGHHADDRAETVLMRILRGTGIDGLAVLPARDGDRARPLLRARRADIRAHLTRHRIDFAEDPTNRDPRFLRTRVRTEVLPLLEALSPRIVEHLCALADDANGAAAARPVLGDLEPDQPEGPGPLGRAHRTALARALAAKNPHAEVRLARGRIARVDLSTGRIVIYKG